MRDYLCQILAIIEHQVIILEGKEQQPVLHTLMICGIFAPQGYAFNERFTKYKLDTFQAAADNIIPVHRILCPAGIYYSTDKRKQEFLGFKVERSLKC
jgi:hypothetical protein